MTDTVRESPQMGFITGKHVLVRQKSDRDWILQEDVVYQGRDQRFTVPAGTETDFASVPRPFAWLVPRYGRFTVAAVLHDFLWAVEVPAKRVSPVDADGIFRRAMRELGVALLLRWFMWGAVRWASLAEAGHRGGWLGQFPKLLLVTLVALPVITLPAVAIGVGYLVFLVLEAVTYGVLRLVALGRPGAVVNPPEPSLRT